MSNFNHSPDGSALRVANIDNRDNIETLYSATEIADKIEALAIEITKSNLEDLLIIAILKGSFIFAADLIRALHRTGMRPEMDFITLASYGTETRSSGDVSIIRDIDSNVQGRSILIIDDILESGRTLAFAKNHLNKMGAKEVKTCVLLNKNVARAVDVSADFSAFECPDLFVIGYGMDLAHQYRELPYIGVLKSPE